MFPRVITLIKLTKRHDFQTQPRPCVYKPTVTVQVKKDSTATRYAVTKNINVQFAVTPFKFG